MYRHTLIFGVCVCVQVKSITQLAQTIASLKFLPLVLSISSDTISRIVNIGRDDAVCLLQSHHTSLRLTLSRLLAR